MTVPSRISYDEGSFPLIKYGHLVHPSEESYELADLGLFDHDIFYNARKSTMNLWTDFLTAVRKDVWAELEKKYKVPLSSVVTEVVVTLPEAWTEKAKNGFLMAADASMWGCRKMTLISGSEAAAVAMVKLMANAEESVTVGDCFVV